jgi:pyridoxal 5'-phosphate synthase pdxS subunit
MDLTELRFGTELIKRGFASMQKGGVIMDVVNAEQAVIAEEAGAVAVMSLERVPSDIRKAGGVARMADPERVMEIIEAVSIPVMGKVRIGHFVEAQVLEVLGVDMIDESEVLTPADEEFHIEKTKFTVPFVCGARNLGEALRRINEGAAMIRTKGEAGTGNVVEAVRHMRAIMGGNTHNQKTRTAGTGCVCTPDGSAGRSHDRDRKTGKVTRSELFCGGDSNSGRRGTHDAPRC